MLSISNSTNLLVNSNLEFSKFINLALTSEDDINNWFFASSIFFFCASKSDISSNTSILFRFLVSSIIWLFKSFLVVSIN